MLLVVTALMTIWVVDRRESYSTRTAEQRSVRLPDGSRVTLGAQTKVTPMFEGNARRVALNFGEAFFEVSHDPNRPFIVIAGSSEIRAVGTSFNVRSTKDRVLVSVTEGRVAVVPMESSPIDSQVNVAWQRRSSVHSGASAVQAKGRDEVLLAAGEQAAVTRAGAVEAKAPTSTVVTWLQGRFEYRGEELRHVIEDLNRYTDRHIVLADESLGDLRYSGTVFPDHLDEWLQGISGALPVAVHDHGDHREITRVQ